ncbi:MAG: alpha/beta fold hydrolase [Candidatus Acidiferrum sp.]
MKDGRLDFDCSRRDFLRGLFSAGVSDAMGLPGAIVSEDVRWPQHESVFELGDLTLQTREILRNARLAYKTHGQLNAAKNNVILYPTQFAAQHNDIEWLIGPGKALDPDKNFIVVPDQLGNGLSSSPSNTAPPQDRMRFPAVTIEDDVAVQHRLVTEVFGVRRVALVTGYSMGAQQAFQWAASYPDMVERIAPFCGTARTTPHNAVFLEGVRAALTADAAWMNGDYQSPPIRGMRALARVYAGWGLSQPFYKEELYKELGFNSLDDFIIGFWERRYMRRDANNLLSMLRTWQLNDLGKAPRFGGSLEKALGAIKAQATVMASQTDLYFTPDDIEFEAARIPGARFRVIPSKWGHMAGAGLNTADSKFIQDEIKALLSA